MERREYLKSSTGLMLAVLTSGIPTRAIAGDIMETPIDTNYTPAGKGIVTGKGVGDFDFLAGEWKIRHKRLKDGTKDEWQRFDSGAPAYRVLNGMCSIEELRKADGSDMGMSVRVWLTQEKKSTDHWPGVGHAALQVKPASVGEGRELGLVPEGAAVFGPARARQEPLKLLDLPARQGAAFALDLIPVAMAGHGHL